MTEGAAKRGQANQEKRRKTAKSAFDLSHTNQLISLQQ
jgi:hypothetical protein